MSDGRTRRPDDGPRSDGNTEETVRYPVTLRPPGVREGDLVPPHMTTAPTPVPEPPTNPLKQTKLGLGGGAPGGVFSGAADFDWPSPSSDAVTRVQAAPMAPPRSAFKKAPSAAPTDDEDERMMNSVGLVEPWLAPEESQPSPFQKTPSTRPPPNRGSGRRSEPEPPPPEPAPVRRERSNKSTQLGLGPNKPPAPPGRASATFPRPQQPARAEPPPPQRSVPPRAEPPPPQRSMPARPPAAPPGPSAPPTGRAPSQAAPAGRARQNTPQPQVHSRAPAPPPPQPQPHGAISRPLPPLQSAPAAPRPGTPAPRSADGVRPLQLNDRDVVDGAVRTGTSQRPSRMPAPRIRTSPLVLGLGAAAVAVSVLAWIALSGSEPVPAPVAAPMPVPAAVTPAAAAPVEAVPPQAPAAPEPAPIVKAEPTPVAEPTPAAPPAAAKPEAAAEAAPKAARAPRVRAPSEPTAPPPTGERRDSILQARDALRALSEGRPASAPSDEPVLHIAPAGGESEAERPVEDKPAPSDGDAPPVLKLEPAPEPPADEPYPPAE